MEPKTGTTIASVFAALFSVVVTVAATLLSLRAGATEHDLFLILTWILIATSLATLIALAVYVSLFVREQLHALKHLKILERLLPTAIIFESRHDTVDINRQGDAKTTFEVRVAAQSEQHIPWIDVPVFVELSPSSHPFSGIRLLDLRVDGVEYNCDHALLPVERRDPYDKSGTKGRVVDVASIRVPIDLSSERQKCIFSFSILSMGAFSNLEAGEPVYVDIPFPTKEIVVDVRGIDGLSLSYAANNINSVEAVQLGTGFIDLDESRTASRGARRTSHLRWSYSGAKVGYEYKIAVAALGKV